MRFQHQAVFVLAVAPGVWLAYRALNGMLGVNPVEELLLTTGLWAFRFLLLSLAVTPLRQLTGWHGVIRFRRTLGLFAFFYACLHLATYLVLDQAWSSDSSSRMSQSGRSSPPGWPRSS